RDLVGQLQAAHRVPGEDAQRQAVVGVGGQPYRLLGGGEPDDRRDRTEHLLRVRGHVATYLVEHGRPVEQPVVPATGGQPGAGGHGRGDQPVDLVPLLLVDDGPQRHLLGGRVADRQVVGVLGQRGHVVVGDALVDDVP